MKYLIYILICSSPMLALAAGGGHGEHDPHAIPTRTIVYQAINIAILLGGLIYFLRQPVAQYFKERRESFLTEANRAEAARKAAEQERADIQQRLHKLETTADESIERARQEAAQMKLDLVAEAQAISKRIQAEAQEAARIEVEKAKSHLRESLIKDSLDMVRTQIASKVTPEDHKRLQSDFISHIQAVQK